MKQEDGSSIVVNKWNMKKEETEPAILKIVRSDKNEVALLFSDGNDYWIDLDELVPVIKRVKDYNKY